MDINDLIRAKLPAYLLKRQEDVPKLRSLLSQKKWEEIKMLGHQLKGNGPTFGFLEIGKIGNELEAAAQKQDEQLTSSLIDQLFDVLNKAKA
jgi:HPt (histidine-containing phosphotransfer) domain-containing protein